MARGTDTSRREHAHPHGALRRMFGGERKPRVHRRAEHKVVAGIGRKKMRHHGIVHGLRGMIALFDHHSVQGDALPGEDNLGHAVRRKERLLETTPISIKSQISERGNRFAVKGCHTLTAHRRHDLGF